MSQVFVSFNDSNYDPTYSPVEEASLVLSKSTGDDENPCAGSVVEHTAPILPRTEAEAQAFAAILGWQVSFDDQDRMVLIPSFDK
jgi:hypothetical protein